MTASEQVTAPHRYQVVDGRPERPAAAAADRRHPVEVTVARLADHVEQYGRHLTPDEVDLLADTVTVLDALHARLEAAARRRTRAE